MAPPEKRGGMIAEREYLTPGVFGERVRNCGKAENFEKSRPREECEGELKSPTLW